MEITEKVEIMESCKSSSHYTDLIAYGECAKCMKSWGKVKCSNCMDKGKVFIPAHVYDGEIVDEVEEDCICQLLDNHDCHTSEEDGCVCENHG